MNQKVNLFILFLSLISIINAQDDPLFSQVYLQYDGTVVNNSITYQTSSYSTILNMLNPVTVSISYESGDQDANVCFNPNQKYFPTPGTDLQYTCPNGGFGVLSNTTNLASSASSKLKFNRKSVNSKTSSHFMKLVEDTSDSNSAQIYVKPTYQSGGFVVNIPDLEGTVAFSIFLSGYYCEGTKYPVGSNNSCIDIEELSSTTPSASASVPPSSWIYYKYTAPAFNSAVLNSLTFFQNDTKHFEMYVQSGYYPTDTWYIETSVVDDDDDGEYQTVNTPGSGDAGEVFFVGLYNTDSSNTYGVYVNVSTSACNSSSIVGPDCSVNLNNAEDPISGVVPISANLALNNSMTFDYSDSETYADSFAYFLLTDLDTINITYPFYIRVSAGNNNLGKYDFPPPLFAKLNAFPSLQSYDYNVTNGDTAVANQLVLPVYSDADEWYIMVQLPSDFTIWVGENCNGNCVGGEGQGTCYCSLNFETVACDTNNTAQLYSLPSTVADSAGVCSCADDSYSQSFDCSQKPNYHIPYLILLAIIGVGIIIVAIAIPVYRFTKRRKHSAYATM